MKKILLLSIIVLTISCKNKKQEKVDTEVIVEVKKEFFPAELGKVFEKHGGIDAWRKAQILSFNKGKEIHTADLHSRKIVINSPKYSLGFDGKEVWLDQESSTAFKGNKDFIITSIFIFMQCLLF